MFSDFDMGLYSKKTFGMYRGEDELVTLRCSNDISDPVIDRFGRDVVTRQIEGRNEFEITVKVAVSPVFLTWIMNFGDQVRIISPESVIKEQVTLAEKVLAQYKDNK